MAMTKTCCCCLLRPPDRDMKTPYSRLGITEIYSDMLTDCFKIHLTLDYDKDYGICSLCVGRLRDASDFKLQVQHSQAELRARLNSALSFKDERPEVKLELSESVPNDTLFIYEPTVKLEVDFTSDYDAAKCSSQQPSVSDHDVKKMAAGSASFERLCGVEAFSHRVGLTKLEDQTPSFRPKNKKQTSSVKECKEKKPYTCNTCELKFDQRRDLTRHMKSCIPNCQICSQNFKTQKKLNLHYRAIHMMGLYKCDICEKVYQHKYALMYHIGTHMKPYCCEICKKKFARKSYLNDHMKTHSSETPYPCDLCKKGFKTKKTLNIHIKCTHSEKNLECDVCFKLFSCLLSLNKHRAIHTDPSNMYCCEICGKQFLVKYRLDSHMLTHKAETPFTCDYCGKKFKCKDGVRQHILVHMGLQPFSCQYCARKFTSSKNLNRHEQSHTGDKPFACNICNKLFRHRYHMRKHTLLHTGVKPHTCETCGKQFADKGNLKTHLQIHVKDNTYYCELCTKSYSTKESLRQHKRVHTTKAKKIYDTMEHNFYV